MAEAEKLLAAELLGDGFHFAGGYSLDIHLGKGRDQSFLRALVAFEELGGEVAVFSLGGLLAPTYLRG